ncbi:MAG: type II toxin-antitoxin system Phd/YefM family antitoxin [Hyphomicrobiales bacterium]|nr:type II toxin-antitoxin system Phd/YefM family antitoxin [Hyphomicrobiales bacterium]MCY4033427.1 type II toxin-antitoxin system Phd/YefM family antitoxin [Hyphomicrobiales bacterium]MCY4038714.1 type II toxin-antitoxin system Phd/YefM family antitoxin [Hyphomicrobiales bacterium]
MKTISVEKAKRQLSDLLKRVQKSPVAIQENNKPAAVLLSAKEYEHFENLENMCWAALADEAFDRNNWVGPEKSEIFLQEMLNARD